MFYLAAAVAVLTVLVVLDLFLTIGVVRRLREHTEQLSRMQADPIGPGIVTTGDRVGEYVATTADGRTVSRADLAGGPTVVGFFSTSCPACERRIPDFVEYARSGPARVLAVVVGSGDLADDMSDRLSGVPGVVVREADEEGPIVRAFAVTAFPSFAVVDGDGAVLSGGASFPEPALSHA
jgi:thiol-disulfide isomerase/thioredoxin